MLLISRYFNRDDDVEISIIPPQESPLLILTKIGILQCNFGPDRGMYQKKKYAEKRDKSQNVDHQLPRKQKCFVYTSRKHGCPAEIRAKEVFLLHEEKVIST